MKLLSLLLLLTCIGCQQVQTTYPSQKIEHIVLVWLKDSSKQNKERVMKASKILFEIKELKAMTMGQPVPSNRTIVDDTFDIGYVMTFDNEKAMNDYLIHPIHVKLVNEVLKPSMKKVLVYDIDTK